MTDAVYRLHPASWVFHSIKVIRRLGFPIIAAAVFGHNKSMGWEVYGLIPMLMVIVYAWFSARVYHYQFGDGELLIREGIFSKTQRHIPYARIQSVSQRHKLLHRLMGVTEVQLDSAAGSKPEAVMKVLSLKDAAQLEDLLRHADPRLAAQSVQAGSWPAPQQGQEGQAAAGAAPLFAMPVGEIIRYGLVSNKGAVVVGLGFGAISQHDLTRTWFFGHTAKFAPARLFSNFLRDQFAQGHWFNIVLALVSLYVVAFIAFRVLSIALAFARYFRFTLTLAGDRLTASHGMSTIVKAHARLQRLQRFVLHENWLHRRLHRCRLAVDVVGGHLHRESSLEASSKFTELAPIATRAQADALLRRCLPELNWDTLEWKPLHANALIRRLVSKARWMVPLAIVLTWIDAWYGWRVPAVDLAALFAAATAAIVVYSILWLRFAALAESGNLLVFRSGVLQRSWVIVRLHRLQNVRLVTSPLDRSLGLVQLEGDIQGGPTGRRALIIPGLSAQEGQQLRDRLWKKYAWEQRLVLQQ